MQALVAYRRSVTSFPRCHGNAVTNPRGHGVNTVDTPRYCAVEPLETAVYVARTCVRRRRVIIARGCRGCPGFLRLKDVGSFGHE